jgi:hypothetical protein
MFNLVVIQPTFTLMVNKGGTGRGTVTSTSPPGAIDCGEVCSVDFADGPEVSLAPNADPGSVFGGWSGCDSVVGTICTVTMNANRTVTATFDLQIFGPAANFAVGRSPVSAAVGNLNGDGALDLVVANNGDGNVLVLLGDGTGSFVAAGNFPVGLNPASVVIGDLNGDGMLDVAVPNAGSNDVYVLLGDATGSFVAGTGSPFAVGTAPSGVAIGDLNGDGVLDLAVANQGSNDVSVLLGDATGSFVAATGSPFAVGTAPSGVAIGDLNGDGVLDLAVANELTSDISILLGDGTGFFSPATPFAVGGSPVSVAIGDLNGDGALDLAVAPRGSSVAVLLGDGTGSFGTATHFPVGNGPSSVVIGDFNGDLMLDLAAANNGSNNISVVLGNGAGSFGPATDFGVDSVPVSMAIGDLNADLKLDLVVANLGSDNVSVLLNATP